jgi:hypothetical protein
MGIWLNGELVIGENLKCKTLNVKCKRERVEKVET